MAARAGSYYTAKFFRHVMIGASAIIVVFLPYKLLQLVGFAGVLNKAHGVANWLGAPPILGYLLTVVIALGAVGALGWLVMVLVRSQSDRIPILRVFARTADRFDDAFSEKSARGRTPIVLIAWPNDNVRTIGMLTREYTDPETQRKQAMIYIPNTPNPLSGIIRVVDTDKLEHTNMSVDDLFALSISRGALAPKDTR